MSEEINKHYEGQGLRGPLWTFAGTSIASLLKDNGILGGLFGGNGGAMAAMASQAAGCAVNDKFSTLEAEIAKLKAEKYTDVKDAELRDSLLKNWLKPLADEAASNKVKIATMEADIVKNKEITELQVKLAEERNRTEHAKMDGAIFSLQGQVGELLCMTRRHMPAENVCPLPMPRFNQWSVDPLANASATANVAGK